MSEENNSSAAGHKFDVVIVGAGSAGIATAASLRKRNKDISIALIDPSEDHYYQPGWTMVGGGVFSAESTHRKTTDLIPHNVTWLATAVTKFVPKDNVVLITDGSEVSYTQLIIAPGLKINWAGIEGLEETLGKNGVTSNYRYDLAPYTWKLVEEMQKGKAIFTQPPMPIKCAGAPQKALYLSASEWFRTNRIKDINIEFYNSGGVLFGVEAYVPALMSYINKYKAKLKFSHTLIKVDGTSKTAWFNTTNADGEATVVETKFDFLHVCPPQCSPDFISQSELSDAAGWLEVDPATLQHTKYKNIWGAGDVINATNAKTMAAARKQAPVVAQNVANVFANSESRVAYDGYGSCPLTVERGKIVLAEFTYGGKLAPTFPSWFNDGTKPTKFSWILKARILPHIYWRVMLKGREWLASPM
jgi:sulfide:quinone oxidoreductase